MKRGYAVSGILYTILILFMVLMLSFLYSMQNKKGVLDKLKTEVVNATNCSSDLVAAKTKISDLETQLNGVYEKELLISILGSTTFISIDTTDLSKYDWLIFIIQDTKSNGEVYDIKSIIKYSDLVTYNSDTNYFIITGKNKDDIIKIYYSSDTSIFVSTTNSTDYITVYGVNSTTLDLLLEK